MSGDVDPRDLDSRERDDGIHDREDEWLTLERGPGSALGRDGDEDVRDRDEARREARDRDGILSAASSPKIRDQIEYGDWRFEFVRLTRQYLHLSSLVGIA